MNRLAIAVVVGLIAGAAHAETLHDAVSAVLASNPTLAEAAARQEALAQTPDEARAAGRLTAEADASGGYSRFDYGKGASGTVTAALPIWSGGRVSAAVRAAKGDVAAGAQGLRDTRAALIQQVVAAYADLLYAQQAVAVAKADIDLLDRQVAEAQARYTLGQSTRTDVAQLQAQKESAVAALADATNAEQTVSATYRALVGRQPQALDATPPSPTGLPPTQDAARTLAVGANPMVVRQRRVADAAAARIAGERAERAPSIGLAGTYGYGVAFGPDVQGYESAAAGGLTFRLPLLTGGLVRARVRAAEATYNADRFAVAGAAREAERASDTAWANLASARARVASGERRVAAAELALKGVRAEYAYALRTTLDILVADESLRAAQLALAQSRSDVLLAQADLLRATGKLDEASY